MANTKKLDNIEAPAPEAAPLAALEPAAPVAPVAPLASFRYSDVRHPVRQGNGILCEVKFDANHDYWSFLATPDDVEPHGRAIYEECDSGRWGEVPDYFPTDAELLEAVQERMARELRRANNEVTKYQDRVDVDRASDADIALLRAWKTYRVDLNELPDQENYPHRLTWPVTPDAPIL